MGIQLKVMALMSSARAMLGKATLTVDNIMAVATALKLVMTMAARRVAGEISALLGPFMARWVDKFLECEGIRTYKTTVGANSFAHARRQAQSSSPGICFSCAQFHAPNFAADGFGQAFNKFNASRIFIGRRHTFNVFLQLTHQGVAALITRCVSAYCFSISSA